MEQKPVFIREGYKGSGKLEGKVAIITGTRGCAVLACAVLVLCVLYRRRAPPPNHTQKPKTPPPKKTSTKKGGDSGIGRAVAVHYAREGADVAVVYLSEHADAQETEALVKVVWCVCVSVVVCLCVVGFGLVVCILGVLF